MIRLGYEVGTGKEIHVNPSHLIVTGITQLSGKTTTLEALIRGSGSRAIVFKTKVGETGFSEGTIIPPYFKERSDWQYVSSLLEATLKEKLKFERSWIIDVCKNANGLIQVHHNIKEKLANPKLRALSRSVLTTLDAYFDLIMPQLQYSAFSKTLEIQDDVNIMDLEKYSPEIQSLVIRSVLEEVLANQKNMVIVIPEAWKFLPQGRGSPCKIAAESFIRQGAVNKNFLWIDSQDMTGVDKTPLKQVSTWILGLQTEKNEVERTLDQIPLPKAQKPKPDEIMSLELGHFYYCSPGNTKFIYVQPVWLEDDKAKKIALGKLKVSEIHKPEKIAPFKRLAIETPSPEKPVAHKFYLKTQQDIAELRTDFFDKIQEISHKFDLLARDFSILKNSQELVNEDMIVSKVLQKVSSGGSINEEEIVRKVLERVPKSTGGTVYKVAPLEKLQRDILEETKQKLLSKISQVNDEQRKLLKYVEAAGKAISFTELTEKCLFKSIGGPSLQKTRDLCNEMGNFEILNTKYGHGKVAPKLKEEIKRFVFGISDQEVEQVYSHILMELL